MVNWRGYGKSFCGLFTLLHVCLEKILKTPNSLRYRTRAEMEIHVIANTKIRTKHLTTTFGDFLKPAEGYQIFI